jgi:hypothetical protein
LKCNCGGWFVKNDGYKNKNIILISYWLQVKVYHNTKIKHTKGVINNPYGIIWEEQDKERDKR